jgi:hypothetical protein
MKIVTRSASSAMFVIHRRHSEIDAGVPGDKRVVRVERLDADESAVRRESLEEARQEKNTGGLNDRLEVVDDVQLDRPRPELGEAVGEGVAA